MPGLDRVLPLLACPHCHAELLRCSDSDHSVVGCGAGHRFDIARQGYLSLLGKGSRTDTGDSADMVAARVRFLGAGHYRPIADAITARMASGPVLDIGAGTGYYLAAALNGLGAGRPAGAEIGEPVGVALDASRYAARRSVAAHPAIGSVVADAWSRLPVRDGVVGTALSVFAPRDPAEIVRVLAPGGRVVVVTPEPDHLAEIRSTVGLLAVDSGKAERLAEAFAGRLRVLDRSPLRQEMALGAVDVAALVRMGPAARHLEPDGIATAVGRLATLTRVTVAVTISLFENA